MVEVSALAYMAHPALPVALAEQEVQALVLVVMAVLLAVAMVVLLVVAHQEAGQ